jgi:hypothetical protein
MYGARLGDMGINLWLGEGSANCQPESTDKDVQRTFQSAEISAKGRLREPSAGWTAKVFYTSLCAGDVHSRNAPPRMKNGE